MTESPSKSKMQTTTSSFSSTSKVQTIETFKVSISTLAFAFLLSDTKNSDYFQEGFLIGEMRVTSVPQITDSDHKVVHVTRELYIQASQPCPPSARFYDAHGKIIANKLPPFLKDSEKKVIGWYRYKSRTPLTTKLSFRETVIHKQLIKLLQPPPPFFVVYCLLSSKTSGDKATHEHVQKVFRLHQGRLEEMPLKGSLSDIVNAITREIEAPVCGGLQTAIAVTESLDRRTAAVAEELAEVNEHLAELEEEIAELKARKKEAAESQ